MRKNRLPAALLLACSLFFVEQPVNAQSPTPKYEFSAQSSLMRFSDLEIVEPGFGARLTYNINKHVAVEAEVNFFPRDSQDYFNSFSGGHKTEGLFGVKAGKRTERFGLFGKVRPGFVNFSRLKPVFECCSSTPPVFEISETDFAIDLGAVEEFYPGGRTFIRVDAGDTVIIPSSSRKMLLPLSSDRNDFAVRSAARSTSHNLQLAVGVGSRLFDDSAGRNDNQSSGRTTHAPRYEIGVQFSSLTLNPHSAFCFDLCIIGGGRTYTAAGGGLRFTYNLTDSIGFEAEGNLFPLDHQDFGVDGLEGRMAQGQFGVKVGKRLQRVGVFGKLRPGFVSFSRVSYLISATPLTFMGEQFPIGKFGLRKRRFSSTDLGAVVEFYPFSHLMTRVDLGDTIIRYGEIASAGNSIRMNIQRTPEETRHNLQFSAGVGLRF